MTTAEVRVPETETGTRGPQAKAILSASRLPNGTAGHD